MPFSAEHWREAQEFPRGSDGEVRTLRGREWLRLALDNQLVGLPSIEQQRRALAMPHYVVLQVILKEKLLGTGSGNLTALEKSINDQAAKGYRLHTITTSSSGSKGIGGGDRIQATMVFESLA